MEPQDLDRSLDLVHAAQDGDKAALNSLLERYYERVRMIIRARMGARLRRTMDSGDVLQGTFMKAVEIFDRFEVQSESSLINWLAQIAQRQILDAADYAGAKKRNVDREVPMDSSPDLHPEADAKTPVQAAEANDREAMLMEALQGLTEEHRELVVQRLYANASWDEIAQQLDKPSAAAARMAFGTAKAKLARRLLDLGYEDTALALGDGDGGE